MAKLQTPTPLGRGKPYTPRGITRMACYRGDGHPSFAQWNLCALSGRWVPICKKCDIALNWKVLNWAGVPNRSTLLSKYRDRIEG